jgi:hypothetical protein
MEGAIVVQLLAASSLPTFRAKVRLGAAGKGEGLFRREAVGTAGFGGILFKAWTAVVMVSAGAIRAFAVLKLVFVSGVAEGLAHHVLAPSGKFTLGALGVPDVLVIGLVLVGLVFAVLVAKIPIRFVAVSVDFAFRLLAESGPPEAFADVASFDHGRDQDIDLLGIGR